MNLPNFFLVGAPKCGTTAIADYLRTHPHVFLSRPKEPYFFGSDLLPFRKREGIENWDSYRELFTSATAEHKAIGEATTLYSVSDDAIEQIVERFENPKFVFAYRDPSQVAYAFYSQIKLHGFEQRDFESAWDNPMEIADAPSWLLDYRRIASLGWQAQRLLDTVPSEQLLLVDFNDFKSDTRQTYLRVLEFLGLEDDGRQEFPVVNASRAARSAHLFRLISGPTARRLANVCSSLFPEKLYTRITAAIRAVVSPKRPRPTLADEMRQKLDDGLAEQREQLSRLTKAQPQASVT